MRIENPKRGIPDLILTADWHLRDTRPRNRVDNYFEKLLSKVDAILQYSIEYGVPIVIAGDIGHVAKWSHDLMQEIFTRLIRYRSNYDPKCYKPGIIAIPGQHDILNHNYSDLPRSTFGLIRLFDLMLAPLTAVPLSFGFYGNKEAESMYVQLCGWKVSPISNDRQKIFTANNISRQILVMHDLISRTFDDEIPGSKSASKILQQYPEYDLILTGDNHQQFISRNGRRLLVNPGSLMRNHIDQIGHEPAVYLYYAENNTVERSPLCYGDPDSFAPQTTKEESVNEELDAFVNSIVQACNVGNSFRKNMINVFESMKISERTKNKIMQAIEEGGR